MLFRKNITQVWKRKRSRFLVNAKYDPLGATKGSLAHCGIWVWAFQAESHKIEVRLGPIDIIWAAPTQIIHSQNYIFHGHLNKTSDNALREGHSCNSSKIKSFSLATLVNFLCTGLVLTNGHPAITFFVTCDQCDEFYHLCRNKSFYLEKCAGP